MALPAKLSWWYKVRVTLNDENLPYDFSPRRPKVHNYDGVTVDITINIESIKCTNIPVYLLRLYTMSLFLVTYIIMNFFLLTIKIQLKRSLFAQWFLLLKITCCWLGIIDEFSEVLYKEDSKISPSAFRTIIYLSCGIIKENTF